MRRASLLAVFVLVYMLGLLWPYELVSPELIHNGAQWTSDRSLRFSTPGLALTPRPTDWQAAAQATGRLRIALRARSFSSGQSGPARLLTVSRDTYAQDLVIGQSDADLIVRLHATCPGERLATLGCRREIRLQDVFASTEWVDVELLIEPGRARLRTSAESSVETTLPLDPLRVWNIDQRVAVGNDVSGNRPWLGEIASAVVETPRGRENQLCAESLDFPETFWLVDREPKLVPFRDASRSDVALNVFLYVPLATVFIFLLEGSVRHIVLRGVFFVAVVSITLELLQLFVRSRNPSMTDVILNIAGGISAIVLISVRQELHRCAGSVIRYFRSLIDQGR